MNPQITDKIGLALTITILSIYICLFTYGFHVGNRDLIGKAFDPDDRACGVDYPDFPFIYFAYPSEKYLHRTVCVKQCPILQQPTSDLDCQPNSLVTYCGQTDSTGNPNNKLIIYNSVPCKQNKCQTQQVLNSICLPTKLQYLEEILPGVQISIFSTIANNISISKFVLMATFFYTISIGCFVQKMMDKFSWLLLWVFEFILIGSFFAISIFYYIDKIVLQKIPQMQVNCWLQFSYRTAWADLGNELTFDQVIIVVKNAQSYDGFIYCAIIIFLLLAVYNIIKIRLNYEKISQIAIELQLSVEFLSWNHKLAYISVIQLFFVGLNFLGYIFTLLNLLSLIEISPHTAKLPFDQTQMTLQSRILVIVASILWMVTSIYQCLAIDFIVQSLVKRWYSEQASRKTHIQNYFWSVIWKVIRYHAGSIGVSVFYSIIIWLALNTLQFVRMIFFCTQINQLEKMIKNLESYQGPIFLEVSQFQSIQKIFDSNDSFRNSQQQLQQIFQSDTNTKIYESACKIVFFNNISYILGIKGEYVSTKISQFIGCVGAMVAMILIQFSESLNSKTLMTPIAPIIFGYILGYQVGYVLFTAFGQPIPSLIYIYILSERRKVSKTDAPASVQNYIFQQKKLFQ